MSFYPPGARIAGRYEVASRPLMGGMGIVYLCLDLEEDRPVALKTFRPEYLPDRAARDRFLREGTHWVELGAHPHVVRCYNVLYTDPEVYLVLELVAKEQDRDDASLRAWLTPGVPLPVEQALLFALQIARGMQHAVDTIPGFVHRDLKPENVLVGADRLPGADLSGSAINRLRVTDFGLAAALEVAGSQQPAAARKGWAREGESSGTAGSLGRTQLTRGVVGTPLYMAPEQWRGERVSIATDVYALGCILYEMVAGQRAVMGHSLAALRRAHCEGQRRPLLGGVPAEVGEVVAHCLAVEAGHRYGSWETVGTALGAAYQAAAGQPAPDPVEEAALSREERVAVGWSYNAMGVSYLDLGKAEVATGYFERAGAVGDAEEELRLQAGALNNLGAACRIMGNAQRSVGFLKQALAICREIGDRRAEGHVLSGLGLAYTRLGDLQRATAFHEQALSVAREVGDRQEEGSALNNLGNVHRSVGNSQQALWYCEQALTVFRQIGNRREEGRTLGNLGTVYAQLGNVEKAISYYQQRLEIARELGDRSGEGIALGNLGNIYVYMRNLQRAIKLFKEALIISQEIGDQQKEGDWLSNLGSAYQVLGDAQQAVVYYEQAGAVFEAIGDAMGTANVDFNMALLLAQQGQLSKALSHAERAAQVCAHIGRVQQAQEAQRMAAQIRTALR
jgi:tetratricopeptide (TPR) repeat protein